MLASSSPAAGVLPAPREHEIKYTLPAWTTGALRAWLSGVCVANQALPPAFVDTVYYDTADLRLLREKVDSDYLKTRVRVRWYGRLDGGAADGPLFAEVKHRVGSQRHKSRVRLDADPASLAGRPLSDAAWTDLLAPLRERVPHLPRGLAPVLALRYTRHRFVDRAGAAHVTLDEHIRVTATNAFRLIARGGGALPVAVLEWKGAVPDIPPHMGRIVRFGARRGAFSKYLACYQLVTRLVL
jgi:hypothetical protein